MNYFIAKMFERIKLWIANAYLWLTYPEFLAHSTSESRFALSREKQSRMALGRLIPSEVIF